MPRRKKAPQSSASAPLWMLTYGDMITLVLTFFVALFSMSNVDAQKYKELAQSLRGALGGNLGVLNQGVTVDPSGDYTFMKGSAHNVYDRLRSILEQGMEGKAELSVDERGIVISFKERMFFQIGSADLLTEAVPLLEEVGQILKSQAFPIRVEGHTCDLPIRNVKYPSNWELSAIRAVNVARFLMEHNQMDPEQISTAAYGQYRPIVPNESEENRARNRRVDIIILNTSLHQSPPSAQL